MKITMQPTGRFERVNGCQCRVWAGVTDAGTEVRVWVPVVQPQTHDAEALKAFETELRELPQPERQTVAVDLRFVT